MLRPLIQTRDLTKKGLRLGPAGEVGVFLHSDQRPDEEGIKTTLAGVDADAPDGLALREIAPSLAGSATVRRVRDDPGALRELGLAIGEGRGRSARWKRR